MGAMAQLQTTHFILKSAEMCKTITLQQEEEEEEGEEDGGEGGGEGGRGEGGGGGGGGGGEGGGGGGEFKHPAHDGRAFSIDVYNLGRRKEPQQKTGN